MMYEYNATYKDFRVTKLFYKLSASLTPLTGAQDFPLVPLTAPFKDAIRTKPVINPLNHASFRIFSSGGSLLMSFISLLVQNVCETVSALINVHIRNISFNHQPTLVLRYFSNTFKNDKFFLSLHLSIRRKRNGCSGWKPRRPLASMKKAIRLNQSLFLIHPLLHPENF